MSAKNKKTSTKTKSQFRVNTFNYDEGRNSEIETHLSLLRQEGYAVVRTLPVVDPVAVGENGNKFLTIIAEKLP